MDTLISRITVNPAICNEKSITGGMLAVDSLKGKYNCLEWHFIGIANDIRNIKNQLVEKLNRV